MTSKDNIAALVRAIKRLRSEHECCHSAKHYIEDYAAAEGLSRRQVLDTARRFASQISREAGCEVSYAKGEYYESDRTGGRCGYAGARYSPACVYIRY